MNRAIFIFLAVLAVQAGATTVRNCQTGADDNKSVTISGCNAPPCSIKRGEQIDITAKFTTTSAVQNPTVDMTYRFLRTRPIPGVDGESACGKISRADGSSAECPLESGVTYVFADKIKIPNIAPSGRGTIRAALKDRDQTVICFKVDLIIAS